jgi:general secretion pathway protein G
MLAKKTRLDKKMLDKNQFLENGEYMKTNKHRDRGLTLVEIMVVLVILGIVMGFLGSKIFGSGDKAKAKITGLKMQDLKAKIEEYRLQYNAVPNSLEDLARCNEQTGSACVPVISGDNKTIQETLSDGWGSTFEYKVGEGGRTYQILSFGADARAGGEGVNGDPSVTGP